MRWNETFRPTLSRRSLADWRAGEMERKSMAPPPEIDRMMWQEHLVQAERHVVLGTEHIAKQRVLIAELEHDGHDARMARDLLYQFEQMQELHVANRDRLRKDLGAA